MKEKYARYLPHSAGRFTVKRFRKAQCPIVERLTNSLMMRGRNNGKKLMSVRIVKHAFEIIHLLTGENPLQVSFVVKVELNEFETLTIFYFRSWSQLSSTPVPVKTLHVLVALVPFVVKPSTFHL